MKLHIGGKEAHPDWKIFDIEKRPEVDYVGNASDLSQFADGSIEAIYASHILEHFYYGLNDELLLTLLEWHRVLKPNGQLMISVPDLRTLCWLYLSPDLDISYRFNLMRIMFGGNMNQYDVHRVGFDIDILMKYLAKARFKECRRVQEFNIFNDSSVTRVNGELISLNVIVTK